MSLVRNEQTKLTATWLNGIAIAAVAVGTIAQTSAAVIGTVPPTLAIVGGGVWLAIGLALHIGARLVLRKLVE